MDAYDDSALFPAFRGVLPTNTFGATGQSPPGLGPVMRGSAGSAARPGGSTTGTSQGNAARSSSGSLSSMMRGGSAPSGKFAFTPPGKEPAPAGYRWDNGYGGWQLVPENWRT